MNLPHLPPIRRILAATDLSACSLPAVCRAAEIAAALDAELNVLYVCPDTIDARLDWMKDEFLRNARQRLHEDLESAVEASGGAVDSHAFVALGHPVDEVLATLVRTDSDLLVVGTHGRSGVEHLMLGSVAEHLGQHAPVDVLLVRKSAGPPYRRLLLALKEAGPARRVAARVAQLVDPLSVERLHTISVYEPPPAWHSTSLSFEELSKRIGQLLEEDLQPVLDDLTHATTPVESQFVQGRAVKEILAAAEHDCDLLFTATHNRPRWTTMLLGDTSRALAHRAKCDVWLVREDRERHPLREAIRRELSLG